MNKRTVYRMGTRGSDLARTQTGMVARMIEALTDIPIETIIIKTRGDRIQDVPLDQIDGKGFFTKEIEDALLNNEIDIAVHSLKDLPTQSPPGLTIAAIPEREDPADLLLVREEIFDNSQPFGLPQNAIVGTSSRRRALQMQDLRPDIEINDLRGNVPTRIRKLVEGRYDAIVIAHSGYRRLGLTPEKYKAIPLKADEMLPAPGQGALAIQTRDSDSELISLLEQLHHVPTATAVDAERSLLDLLGGGCGMPLGTLATAENGSITLRAALGSDEWLPGDPALLHRVRVNGADAHEAADSAKSALGNGFETGGSRTRIKATRVFMPVIENGAADNESIFAGLPVEFISLPLLEIVPIVSQKRIEEIQSHLGSYDWIVFSSANAVKLFFDAFKIGAENTPKIACVGPDTKRSIEEAGYKVDFVPTVFNGDALATEFIATNTERKQKILLPRPDKMGSRLEAMLSDAGYSVESIIMYSKIGRAHV